MNFTLSHEADEQKSIQLSSVLTTLQASQPFPKGKNMILNEYRIVLLH